uniref:DRMBL domain-containing protein n=1 Tax=Macrostomum lignano TaxID=282301 RepID=A0A1I8FMR2_9PLAT
KQCPATIELIFYFSVKFYPPDPHLLEDEYTSAGRHIILAPQRTHLKVLPQPYTEDLLKKSWSITRRTSGLTPEDSEYSLLDTARKVNCTASGCTPARITKALPLKFRQLRTPVGPKVRKLSFKRRKKSSK